MTLGFEFTREEVLASAVVREGKLHTAISGNEKIVKEDTKDPPG